MTLNQIIRYISFKAEIGRYLFFCLVISCFHNALSKDFYISYIVPETKSKIDPYTMEQLKKIQGPYKNTDQLRSYINDALLGTGLRNIIYELKGPSLHIKFDSLVRIKQVKVNADIPANINIEPFLIKENEHLEVDKIDNSINNLKIFFKQRGYKQTHISVERSGNTIIYNINVGVAQKLTSVKVVGGDLFLKKQYTQIFEQFLFKPINLVELSKRKEALDRKMKEFGYFSLNSKLITNQNNQIEIKLRYYGPYIFNFTGHRYFSYFELKKIMREQFRTVDAQTSENLVLNIIEASYKNVGFYNVKLKIAVDLYRKNKQGQVLRRFNISINEGKRRKFNEVVFKGNRFLNDKKLWKYYKKKQSSLLKGRYIDEKGSERLVKEFQLLYIKNGYLSQSSRVKIPYGTSSEVLEKQQPNIDFIFNEGNQTIVSSFDVVDINEDQVEDEYITELSDKYKDRPVNPFLIEQDIQALETHIKSQGYLDARVVNQNQKNLVSYSKDRSQAKIKIVLERGYRHKLGDVYVFGNFKTKDKLVLKHINSSRYVYITPTNLDEFKKNLFALGLFQSVGIEVKPSSKKNLSEGQVVVSDLIIRVKEGDYGRIEIIPGLRSDTGVKLGANIGYSNLGGMGRSLRWTSNISQRLTYSVFDEDRNAGDNKFLEYAFNLSFTEIDFLKKNINYLAQLGTRRRRFFAFDARVSRFANTLSYSFPRVNLNTSIGHQYEAIKQENGSSSNDNGEFKIGSLVPKLTYDWRDNLANPRSGGSHQLDIEWADKTWLSQDVNGESVNFTKYVLRNRFYLPFKRGTLAFGWTAGIQQNDSNSPIPGIKIFRLTGIDQVRGFSDDEINRLPNGGDISQSNLINNAYLNSIKVEPRFFINDNLMIGAFWDAGRVTLDESQFFNLKQSVGLSLRILTPVGSINLDYGQKLDPETFADGSVESSGRFHLSIGLF